MTSKILLTSFQTWMPHQNSNAADDLLDIVQRRGFNSQDLSFLRKLAVDIPQASGSAIDNINKIEPDLVICCGMAESREILTIESNATNRGDRLYTSVDVEKLVSNLAITEKSDNAGKFVCEGLYFQVLKHLQKYHPHSKCIFVHVPVLTDNNCEGIISDFNEIIDRL